MQQKIIWRGDEQKFTAEHLALVDVILGSMIGSGRYIERYWQVMEISLPNIRELFTQGYIIHHIDGNPGNDHPSNLMVMTRSAHTSIHGLLTWAKLSEEDHQDWCDEIAKGLNNRSKEDKCIRGEKISRSHANRSEEAKQIYVDKLSRGHGGAGVRANIYLKSQLKPFFIVDIQKVAKFSGIIAMNNWMKKAIQEGRVECIGQKGKSKIYENIPMKVRA